MAVSKYIILCCWVGTAAVPGSVSSSAPQESMAAAAQATHEEEWSAHLSEDTVEEQPTFLSNCWLVCLHVFAFIILCGKWVCCFPCSLVTAVYHQASLRWQGWFQNPGFLINSSACKVVRAHQFDIEAVQASPPPPPTSATAHNSDAAQFRRQLGKVAALLTRITTCQSAEGLEATGQASSPDMLNSQVNWSPGICMLLSFTSSASDAGKIVCLNLWQIMCHSPSLACVIEPQALLILSTLHASALVMNLTLSASTLKMLEWLLTGGATGVV